MLMNHNGSIQEFITINKTDDIMAGFMFESICSVMFAFSIPQSYDDKKRFNGYKLRLGRFDNATHPTFTSCMLV